jgi:ketosteroid isomerase-like protein
MKKLLLVLAIAALAGLAPARARNERAEIEALYKSMSKAFAAKDVTGCSAYWAPAIRWFPPRSASTTTLTKGRANLLHDLRVEFASHKRVEEDFALSHVDTDPAKATIELAVSVTYLGPSTGAHTLSERHHWLKAGGRWWLSRIEALG